MNVPLWKPPQKFGSSHLMEEEEEEGETSMWDAKEMKTLPAFKGRWSGGLEVLQ